MSRAVREAHEDGECGFFCYFCDREDGRDTPVTLTSDGIDIPPLDTHDGEGQNDNGLTPPTPEGHR